MRLHCSKSSLQQKNASSVFIPLPPVVSRLKVTGGACARNSDRLHVVAEAAPHAMATQSATVPDNDRIEQEPESRKILLAVDGTDDSVNALQWMLECLCRPGDIVHLCHVVCNERVAPTSVGASGYGGTGGRNVMASVDEDFGRERRIEYLQRKEQEANNMLASRFMPLLFNGQVRYQVDLVVADGLRSAATIGDTIVRTATRLDTDILVIASHGTGLLADYGSVARYCTQHFRGALILVPPHIESFADRREASVACGVNTESEVAAAAAFVLDHIARPDDVVHVLHAFEERLVATGSNDNAAIVAAVQQQVKGHKVKEAKVSHLPMEQVLAGDERNKHSAQQVLQAAADSKSRALVLVNYATQGMMQEMMLGSLAMHCSRSASLPLVLIPPGSF